MSKYKNMYTKEFYEVRTIINKFDPIGFFPGAPEDEYDPEVSDILLVKSKAKSVEELNAMIYEVFVKWFDDRWAGSVSDYYDIAAEIWKLKGE